MDYEPGTKYLYSPGPAVGGRIVEVVGGRPYPDFLQQRLLDPLGLQDTTFWPNTQQAARLALPHELNPGTKTLEPLRNIPIKNVDMPPRIASQFGGDTATAYQHHFGNPAGGLFSTAADVARFCQMLLNGGTYQGKKYLSSVAVKEMSSLQTGTLMLGDDGYGIGCFVQQKAQAGLPSVGSFGHHGARKTQMWIDPHNQLVMVLMVQCWDLTHKQQSDLYTAYRQQSIARYGNAGGSP